MGKIIKSTSSKLKTPRPLERQNAPSMIPIDTIDIVDKAEIAIE